MNVVVDNELNRHIEFKYNHNGWNENWNVTTWKGHICLSGVFGTFVFARLDDMFEFHRVDWHHTEKLNYDYWYEKCQSVSKYFDCFEINIGEIKDDIIEIVKPFDLSKTAQLEDFFCELLYDLQSDDCTYEQIISALDYFLENCGHDEIKEGVL